MRTQHALLVLLLTVALAGAAPLGVQAQAPASWLAVTAVTAAQAQSAPAADQPSSTKVEVRHESSTTTSGWPVSPLWLAVGGIALVALIALIVAASRRETSSTTVVK